MWLVAVTGLAAAALFLLAGGSLVQLSRLRVVGIWLLIAGLVAQAALEYVSLPNAQIETVGYGLLMASYALIIAFCVTNLSTPGFAVILIGVAMNAVVIGLNQGMPTKPIGNDSHGNRVYKPVERTAKHRQATGADLLGFLGDRIIFPKPFDTVVSFGDLVIAAGICELVYFASRPKRTPASTRDQAAVH
jgi:hypothetical protein